MVKQNWEEKIRWWILEVLLKNNLLHYEKKAQEHYCTTEDDNFGYKCTFDSVAERKKKQK